MRIFKNKYKLRHCSKCDLDYIGHFNSIICDKCKTKKCKNCNNDFVNVHSHYCSRECLLSSTYTLKGTIKTGKTINCLNCDVEFYTARWQGFRKFCCEKCSYEHRKRINKHNKIPCNNIGCVNILFKSDAELRKSKNGIFYCSVRCLNLARSQKAFEMRKCSETKPELKFAEYLKNNNIDFCMQYWVNMNVGWKKWYDFYLPNIDTLVEIDGIYWHGKNLNDFELNAQQKRTRTNDKIKNKLAYDNNYKLIRIWEDEIDLFDFNTLKG